MELYTHSLRDIVLKTLEFRRVFWRRCRVVSCQWSIRFCQHSTPLAPLSFAFQSLEATVLVAHQRLGPDQVNRLVGFQVLVLHHVVMQTITTMVLIRIVYFHSSVSISISFVYSKNTCRRRLIGKKQKQHTNLQEYKNMYLRTVYCSPTLGPPFPPPPPHPWWTDFTTRKGCHWTYSKCPHGWHWTPCVLPLVVSNSYANSCPCKPSIYRLCRIQSTIYVTRSLTCVQIHSSFLSRIVGGARCQCDFSKHFSPPLRFVSL